jgi:hypothetical protein
MTLTAPGRWASDEPTGDFHELSSESVGTIVSGYKLVTCREESERKRKKNQQYWVFAEQLYICILKGQIYI